MLNSHACSMILNGTTTATHYAVLRRGPNEE